MRIQPLFKMFPCILLFLSGALFAAESERPAPSKAEADEIAIEAYLYAYPLVLMDASREAMTNVAGPTDIGMAPVNQFGYKRTFPDASFTAVVRPNADTLYCMMWFDVSKEPLVISIPDSGGRYYLLPMLDMWTDIFDSPGKRTTGTEAQTYVLIGPHYDGDLPKDVAVIEATTSEGWIIGRTQANGPDDFAKVNAFQSKIKTAPLSALAKVDSYVWPKSTVKPTTSKLPPVERVAKMTAAEFFNRFSKLTVENPPHQNDYPQLARLSRLGFNTDEEFDFAKQPEVVKAALNAAPAEAQKRIMRDFKHAGTVVNNWQVLTAPIGTYGTAYLRRAGIAYAGLGANVCEDAIYPTAFVDSEGKPLDSGRRYEMKFAPGQTPPVRAFWSLTMYNDKQFFAANPINRYTVGDRSNLKANPDGSITLYIQRESPGKEKESNWLPAPKEGGFSMNLRLYWPQMKALDGEWSPPPVTPVK